MTEDSNTPTPLQMIVIDAVHIKVCSKLDRDNTLMGAHQQAADDLIAFLDTAGYEILRKDRPAVDEYTRGWSAAMEHIRRFLNDKPLT